MKRVVTVMVTGLVVAMLVPAASADNAAATNPNAFSLTAAEFGANLQDDMGGSADNGYREVSSFFNVRESHANVSAGEWELEVGFEWETGVGDDDFALDASLKYGFTDSLYGEIEVQPIQLGDGGGRGAGDLGLLLFHECVKETDTMPGFAAWADMTIPSGDGSEGVDASLHITFTKSVATNCRLHFEGFVATINAEQGDPASSDQFSDLSWWLGMDNNDDDGRRDFQYGLGIGADYSFSDQTIGVINYSNRAGDRYGQSNTNVLELGMVHEIAANQHIKAAVDFDLNGDDDTADFGAKLQWTIDW